MTDTPVADLKKTPLDARHRASKARMVPYAGWDMPVEYSGITAEHLAPPGVRVARVIGTVGVAAGLLLITRATGLG